jgi:hypothetical protein
MEKRKMTQEEKDDAAIAKILGYRGNDGKVYHNHCLCTHPDIEYDESKILTKQIAYKEGLICSICNLPICPDKHSKFLQRVADAKRHRTT